MQISPFEFVTVFYSVILGLALTHIFRAVSDLYEIRERVETYWLNTLWVVTVIMWSIFQWWGLWELSEILTKWNYLQYWIMVTNLASIYFFTTLVLPKATDEGTINLRDHYYSVHTAFFIIVAYSLYSSSAINFYLFSKDLISIEVIAPFVVGCLALAAAFVKTQRYHQIIGILILIIFLNFQLSHRLVIEYAPS